LDSKRSTAGLHATFFFAGIKEGFIYPIGNGLGVGLINKFGVEREGTSSEGESIGNGNTEVDISDCFVTLGLVGGILYLVTIYLVVRRAISFGRTAPKYIGLPTLGLLAAMVGSWIALGQYGMGPLIWFVIGALVRDTDQRVLGLREQRSPEGHSTARLREAPTIKRLVGS
jgi:hypothetical protein